MVVRVVGEWFIAIVRYHNYDVDYKKEIEVRSRKAVSA